MADARRAREIVRELPVHNAAKCCEEISRWLKSLCEAGEFTPERLFENISLLDAAAKEPTRLLMREFSIAADAAAQHRLWNTVNGVWRTIADAYGHGVAQCQRGSRRDKTVQRILPVQVARGIRALRKQLTWSLMRYDPPESRIWGELFRLYQVAEAGGFSDTRIEMYRDVHGSGSARQEFAKAIMISASSTLSVPADRQDLAQRLVAHFSIGFRVATSPLLGCNYRVDLAVARAPSRVARGPTGKPTHRYCSVGEGLNQLEQVISTVIESGSVPWYVNLGGSYPKEIVLGVLEHLRAHWSDTPPARRLSRRPTAASITVVRGLTGILRVVGANGARVADAGGIPGAETWVVENKSDFGYGAIVPGGRGAWARVGELVGVRSDGLRYWGIGIIRSMTRDQYQQRRVGIQLIGRAAIPVKLVRPAAVAAANGADGTVSGILLSTTLDEQGEIGVVIGKGLFNARESLEMGVNNMTYPLMPATVIEGGEDYDWAHYRVIHQIG